MIFKKLRVVGKSTALTFFLIRNKYIGYSEEEVV